MKESSMEEEKELMMMMRSASDKERTKMRERQRRSITTKIFNGLRKHGGYNLPPRSDINDVLRELAREAGWVVEPDGTTYRAPSWFNHHHHQQNNKSSSTTGSAPNVVVVDQHFAHYHSCCLAGKGGKTPTPTSSFGGGGGGSGGGSGEFSTTASPGNVQDVLDATLHGVGSVLSGSGPHTLYLGGGLSPNRFPSGGVFNGTPQRAPATVDTAAYTTGMARMMTPHQFCFSECRASSEDSPVDSPHHGPH